MSVVQARGHAATAGSACTGAAFVAVSLLLLVAATLAGQDALSTCKTLVTFISTEGSC